MNIHFIGIGGIGISGLAQFMHHKGNRVSGSDIASNRIVNSLKERGVPITIPHCISAINRQDIIIHSAVIKDDNVEIVEAKKQGIDVLSRRDALMRILHDREVYAVAGAHGKSTTSAILASILSGSAIIGAESKEFGSNVRYEDGDRLIFEADESDGSFLNSNPYCAIVTNAEPEHMEYYEYDYDRFYNAYREFISSATLRVLNAEDPFLQTLDIDAILLYPSIDITDIEYILKDSEPYTRFKLKDLGEFEVWGFGEHIALDASLAILAANISEEIDSIRKNISLYCGIKKRFDILSKTDNCVIIDDYAHHPTEISASLSSAKIYSSLKDNYPITAIWQPHKYSRTLDNIEQFIECFKGVDRLYILPVWEAGEKYVEIDFKTIFVAYNPTMIEKCVRNNSTLTLHLGDGKTEELNSSLIIGFGAGDITYQLRGET